ncbi:MAG: YHYH protein [Planctomycetales bacterium]|nr:YHYH protein [Planctomycetales bacterium]
MRTHSITEKGQLDRLPATQAPPTNSEVSITIEGDQRVIVSNGIPNHKTGQFPNRGNPNRITAQRHEYRIPANPQVADEITPMHGEFGVAVNGIPFDPGAAEFYDGEPGWQYEPLSGAIDLGIDMSHAHVQPTGKYHYHGLPSGLIDSIEVKAGSHSPLVGWAADGFPMYAVYGYTSPKDANSPVRQLVSSYQLKKGERPGGDAPGGEYDGTFVRDYEYVAGSGDLDECNGRFTVTPEYPEGIYAYFLTENWPVVPRYYRGTPSADFRHGPGPAGPGGNFAGGPGGDRRGGPRMEGGRGMRGGPGREGPFDGQGFGPSGPGQPGPSGDPFSRGEFSQRAPGQRGPRGAPGMGGFDRPPRPGQILPPFLIDALNLSQDQRAKLDELQATVDQELKSILTEEQLEQLESPRSGPAGGQQPPPGGPPGGFGGQGFGGQGFGGPPGSPSFDGGRGRPGGGRPTGPPR